MRHRFRGVWPHARRWLCILLVFLVLCPPPVSALSIQEEEQLGREFMDQARRRFRFVTDPLVVSYVEDMGRRLLAALGPQPFEYQFHVFRHPVYNAFAGPAGHIFISTGIITAMQGGDELAGILAHEMVHVSARHISAKLDRAGGMSLAALAGVVAGILLGVAGGGAAASAVGVTSMAAAQSANLAYSRQDEAQADDLGMEVLRKAGYSGTGLLRILKVIRDAQWISDADVPTYLMTHPAVSDRIAYIDAWISRNPQPAEPSRASEPERFRVLRTRLVAAYGDQKAALSDMTAALAEHPDDPLVIHGYGIALARNDQPGEGAAWVRKALARRPFDAVMLKDLGEISFMAGKYEEALAALDGSQGIDAEDGETAYLKGRALLALERPAEAAVVLEELLGKSPDDRHIFHYLGEAFGKTGEMGNAHFFLARYHWANREPRNALFHLNQAEKYELSEERREEIRKMRGDVATGGGDKGADEPGAEERPRARKRGAS